MSFIKHSRKSQLWWAGSIYSIYYVGKIFIAKFNNIEMPFSGVLKSWEMDPTINDRNLFFS